MMPSAEVGIRISELEMLIDIHCSCEICSTFRAYVNKRVSELKVYKEEKEKLESMEKKNKSCNNSFTVEFTEQDNKYFKEIDKSFDGSISVTLSARTEDSEWSKWLKKTMNDSGILIISDADGNHKISYVKGLYK